MATLLHRLRRARWPITLAIALSLLTYWLIPLWLSDDEYTQILIPDFQLPLKILMLLCLIVAVVFFIGDNNPQRNPVTLAPLAFQQAIHSRFNHSSTAESIWTLSKLNQLNPDEFEALWIAYYQVKGIKSSTCDLGSDGGINIRLYTGAIIHRVVHCCSALHKTVEVGELRAFLGVMMHERATSGVFIHLGAISHEARVFANAHRIHLRDEHEMLAKLSALSQGKQERLRKKIKDIAKVSA